MAEPSPCFSWYCWWRVTRKKSPSCMQARCSIPIGGERQRERIQPWKYHKCRQRPITSMWWFKITIDELFKSDFQYECDGRPWVTKILKQSHNNQDCYFCVFYSQIGFTSFSQLTLCLLNGFMWHNIAMYTSYWSFLFYKPTRRFLSTYLCHHS